MDQEEEIASISLIGDASEAELASFSDICMREHFRVIPDGPLAGCLSVLLVGAGRAQAVRRRLQRLRNTTFTLLVCHDEAVLEQREILEHCENILIAPFDGQQLVRTLSDLGSPVGLDRGIFQNIVGRSSQLRALLRIMSLLAGCDAPVLITGETGTGKELIARGIHYNSPRRDNAFVPVNCGALQDELLLAELFGYEKGAFTDAKRTHRGLVEQASGGVLFLDEVDSLTPRGQVALLRFLQDQEYRPVGSNTLIKSDVRVLSATNKELAKLVTAGAFREDLYYRLHLLDVHAPPLRSRAGDIEVLAEHFLGQLSTRYGVPSKTLHPLTRKWMLQYEWPGNIRELQNYLHRVFVLCRGPMILAPALKGNPISVLGEVMLARMTHAVGGYEPRDSALLPFNREKGRVLEQFEQSYLHKVMLVAKGNVSLAARCAGKERKAFRRLLKKHGIERDSYST